MNSEGFSGMKPEGGRHSSLVRQLVDPGHNTSLCIMVLAFLDLTNNPAIVDNVACRYEIWRFGGEAWLGIPVPQAFGGGLLKRGGPLSGDKRQR